MSCPVHPQWPTEDCPLCLIEYNAFQCKCVVLNRNENESQREWFKRWMCMYHWMQTDYYRNKLDADSNPNVAGRR